MTNAEITRAFIEKGWEIRYRGGNSICSTPSDMEMVVADALGVDDAPRPPEARPRYFLAAWPADDGPRPQAFDLYDAERDLEVRVHRVPTPEQAEQLLERSATGEPPTGRRGHV